MPQPFSSAHGPASVEYGWVPAIGRGAECVGATEADIAGRFADEAGCADVRAPWVLHAASPRPAAARVTAANVWRIAVGAQRTFCWPRAACRDPPSRRGEVRSPPACSDEPAATVPGVGRR